MLRKPKDILAIDIGGAKHSLALFHDGRLTRRETWPTDVEGGRPWMVDRLRTLGREWRQAEPPAACGIGFGGPVDFAAQRVGCSMHVGGWEDFPLSAALEEALGIPCRMDNDANLGALGEYTAGAGRGCRSLLYMTLSTGIGAGILMDGRILRGADSLAGELGHISLDPEGPVCSCGSRGCFEALCSGRAIEQRTGRPPAELLQDPAFRAGYIPTLARGLRAALLLLNPQRVVIGGGLSKAGETLFAELRAELCRQIPGSLPVRVDIQPAALGDDSVLWGAFALVAP
ncbi:MAG: ROK family protein [Acidobacteria bacterium]|nr:ROK family protein [Acidobacteriota bacterium]